MIQNMKKNKFSNRFLAKESIADIDHLQRPGSTTKKKLDLSNRNSMNTTQLDRKDNSMIKHKIVHHTPSQTDHDSVENTLKPAIVMSDHELRELLVRSDLAANSLDPVKTAAVQTELQAKTLLMLNAIDWKLWVLYNKFAKA